MLFLLSAFYLNSVTRYPERSVLLITIIFTNYSSISLLINLPSFRSSLLLA